MYALFVNMYDNLYYMLTQEIKAICAWCCTGLLCERTVRGDFISSQKKIWRDAWARPMPTELIH